MSAVMQVTKEHYEFEKYVDRERWNSYYKYNWDNETYKTNKHILVQDIRRDAEQAIQLYRDQISAVVKAKNRVYVNKMVGDKVDKLQEV